MSFTPDELARLADASLDYMLANPRFLYRQLLEEAQDDLKRARLRARKTKAKVRELRERVAHLKQQRADASMGAFELAIAARAPQTEGA